MYLSWIKRFVGIRSVRYLMRKEVIIHDPDYRTVAERLSQLTEDCKEYPAKQPLRSGISDYCRLWMRKEKSNAAIGINNELESLIEELSNTTSKAIMNALNNYPVLNVQALSRPFHAYQLNLLTGLIFPVGLVLYLRILVFRKRLLKDIEEIVRINGEVLDLIRTK
jgi:lipopolysaccharide export system permease protein